MLKIKYTHITDLKNNQFLWKLGKIANDNNFEIFLVGGAVRDMIMGRETNDYDISVIGDALELVDIVAKEFKVKPVVFPRYGTAMVPYDGIQYEFVGTRKEEYVSGSRNPIVSTGTFEDDILRRDFTINSLAIRLNGNDQFGEVVDIIDGISDIENKILRTPADPNITFSEDPLRMLRAIRFSSQLGFDIDIEAINAILRNHSKIEILSIERISSELFKILQSPEPAKGIARLKKYRLLKYFLSELTNLSQIEFDQTLKFLTDVREQSDNEWDLFIALLSKIPPGRVELKFTDLKLPKSELSYVVTVIEELQSIKDPVKYFEDINYRELIFKYESNIERYLNLLYNYLKNRFILLENDYSKIKSEIHRIREINDEVDLVNFRKKIKGDLVAQVLDVKPGPVIGEAYEYIQEALIEQRVFCDADEMLNLIISNKSTIIQRYKEKRNGHQSK